MAKKKKPSKTYYKRKADRIFSLWIRNRDGVCQANAQRKETCESPDYLQCAHIVSRDYSATRLDPGNAMALCRSCHMYFTQRPLEWEEFVIGYMGEDDYYRLKVRALAGARRSHPINWEDEAERWEREWTGK